MPLLVILKRFEIWLLVAVVSALIWFAFQTEPTEIVTATPIGSPATTEPESAPETKPTLLIHEVQVHTTKGGTVVDLTLSGRSPTGEDLVLNSSNLSARTADGEVVNRFFEPFRESAVLLSDEDTLATTRWWLERPTEAIWIQLGEEKIKAVLP
jgi:hypothetical protein